MTTPIDPPKPESESLEAPLAGRHAKRPRRHHHHKMKGKFVVLSMVFFLVAYFGLALYFSIRGYAYPLIATWGYTTQLIIHSLVAAVVLLCLFRFYRGSVSVKQVMGLAGMIVAAGLAILLTISFLTESITPWSAFDASGLIIGAFVAWVCFFSRGASSFMNYQQDH